jgi:hypothetical protein
MTNHRIARHIALVLVLFVTAATAHAGVHAYASVELAQIDTSNESGERLPYAYDNRLPGFPVATVGHGNGMHHEVRFGAQFGAPIFVEFGNSRSVLSEAAQTGVDGAGGACNLEPALGRILDCWNQANVSQRTELRNRDLIVGWRFDLAARTRLSPYAGWRRVRINDTRIVDYNFIGGFVNHIADESFFDERGWIAGLRASQDFAHFFLDAEVQVSRAKGQRSRELLDVETHTPTGAVTATERYGYVDQVTVHQRMARLGIGKRFDLGGLPSNVSLGYRITRADGFDTRSTAQGRYAPGQLGSGDAEIETRGVFLRLEVNR